MYLFVLCAFLYSCGDSTKTSYKPEWKVGCWVWGSYVDDDNDENESLAEAQLFDIFYVKVGESRMTGMRQGERALNMWWPKDIPKANSYYAVWRCEGAGCLSDSLITDLVKSYHSIKNEAKKTGMQVAGLQIDYDCSTTELLRYAHFLRGVKIVLPKDDILSITTLLDWFRPGTKVAEVIRWSDEFIPQFYDNNPQNNGSNVSGVAEMIDSAKWAPVFNAFRKPYRIGISSVGRIVETYAGDAKHQCSQQSGTWFRRENILEIMEKEKISPIRIDKSLSGETIVFYKSNGDKNIRKEIPCSEKLLKMVIPTRQSVFNAFNAAKAMGGYCSGVVFFRWPDRNEVLALTRQELEDVLRESATAAGGAPTIEVEDGLCAAVSCNDIYIRLPERFPAQDVVFIVRSSTPLDYFVPGRFGLAVLRGPQTIEVKTPAYTGLPRIAIGRAVSISQARFSVESGKQ